MKDFSTRPVRLGQVETIKKVTGIQFVESEDKKDYRLMFINGLDPDGIPIQCMVTVNNEAARKIAIFQGILPQLGIYKVYDDEPVIKSLKAAKKPVPTGNKVFCSLFAEDIMKSDKSFSFKCENVEREIQTLKGPVKKVVTNTIFNPAQFEGENQ